MAANNSVNIASDTTVLSALRMALPADQRSRAESPALAANETISMKPSAATRPRLAARLRINEKIGSSLGLAWNVVFSAVRISPNTPDGVTGTVTTPASVAVTSEVGIARSLQDRFDEFAARRPQQPAEFRAYRGTRGILRERQACDGKDDEEHGRHSGCILASHVLGRTTLNLGILGNVPHALGLTQPCDRAEIE